jgi:hypothetical protein
MDAKIFVYGFCLVAIITGASFWAYTMEIDEAQKDVFQARQQSAVVTESIKQAKAWLVARKEAAALIAAAQIIEQDNLKLTAEIEAIKQDRTNLAKAFLNSIQRAREESIGVVIPEVSLVTGTTLRQARIQSIDSEITIFQHSEGVSKVPSTTLPKSLLERFKFGFSPGGVTANVLVIEEDVATPTFGSSMRPPPTAKISTAASDSVARIGMNDDIATIAEKKKKAARPAARDPNLVKTRGDPALWQSVERSSIGRAYIPGQGWLKVGPDGPIPGSARK